MVSFGFSNNSLFYLMCYLFLQDTHSCGIYSLENARITLAAVAQARQQNETIERMPERIREELTESVINPNSLAEVFRPILNQLVAESPLSSSSDEDSMYIDPEDKEDFYDPSDNEESDEDSSQTSPPDMPNEHVGYCRRSFRKNPTVHTFSNLIECFLTHERSYKTFLFKEIHNGVIDSLITLELGQGRLDLLFTLLLAVIEEASDPDDLKVGGIFLPPTDFVEAVSNAAIHRLGLSNVTSIKCLLQKLILSRHRTRTLTAIHGMGLDLNALWDAFNPDHGIPCSNTGTFWDNQFDDDPIREVRYQYALARIFLSGNQVQRGIQFLDKVRDSVASMTSRLEAGELNFRGGQEAHELSVMEVKHLSLRAKLLLHESRVQALTLASSAFRIEHQLLNRPGVPGMSELRYFTTFLEEMTGDPSQLVGLLSGQCLIDFLKDPGLHTVPVCSMDRLSDYIQVK